MHGSVAWKNCHFEVIDHVAIGGQENGYILILRDKAAGFAGITEGLDVFENCKPIF